MTRNDLMTLKQAADILDRLADTDGKNEVLPTGYRNAVRSADDELSMLIYTIENGELDKILDHPFNNDDLFKAIQDGDLNKDDEYEAQLDKETHGEFTLILKNDATDEQDQYSNQFENYLDKDDANKDVDVLIALGYKITKAIGFKD